LRIFHHFLIVTNLSRISLVVVEEPKMLRYRAPAAYSVLAALALSLTACDTPDAVSQFCGSAVATLTAAKPVLEDQQLSCLREVNSREPLGSFKPPITAQQDCTEIGTKASGFVAATELLSSYFATLNALASFGTAQAGVDTNALLAQTSAAFGANSDTQQALGGIAQFVVTITTAGYQQKKLAEDLTKTRDSVPKVINALVVVVRDDYIGRTLNTEEQKLAAQYKEFARNQSSENVLILDQRWRADEAALQARRSAAQDLVSALESLSAGFSDVAANADKLTAKELPGLLAPYVSQLQTLIPEIQKAF
jgi:hypothetical protein